MPAQTKCVENSLQLYKADFVYLIQRICNEI